MIEKSAKLTTDAPDWSYEMIRTVTQPLPVGVNAWEVSVFHEPVPPLSTIVWAATLPEVGPTGGFFKEKRQIAW